MKLLFITQKLHGQDAFGILWIKAFQERGYEVDVICLEWREDEAKKALGVDTIPFTVHSLGKENGSSKLMQIVRFTKLTWMLSYDRVFIHMAPVWGLLGAKAFILRRKPTYLWYTHYKMQMGLWLLGIYGKRLFCATEQSLPQYEHSPKKIVTGHGIDMEYWPMRKNQSHSAHQLLAIHRLSRSKRLELVLHAMKILPSSYTLDVYGIYAEKDYADEMRSLTKQLELDRRVTFHGTVPSKDLADLYSHHRLIVNMASETIDKTMLEAMTCGCYPVTTKGNAAAIGIPDAPSKDSSDAIADFILAHEKHLPLDENAMYKVVTEKHSLRSLIRKMDHYIHKGI